MVRVGCELNKSGIRVALQKLVEDKRSGSIEADYAVTPKISFIAIGEVDINLSC